MSVEGFRVQVAGAADLAEVLALERSVAEAPHWAEADYAAIVNVNVDGVADGRVRRCLLIAEGEGRLVGFAVGKVIGSAVGGVAELESVVVDLTARRRGVGKALCRVVAAWSRERGATALELEVRAGSGGAIALYVGLGFIVVGRRGGYYRDPVEDAVLMRLELEKSQ